MCCLGRSLEEVAPGQIPYFLNEPLPFASNYSAQYTGIFSCLLRDMVESFGDSGHANSQVAEALGNSASAVKRGYPPLLAD